MTSLQIGILTRGKPTLALTMCSLILQDLDGLRIHVVDTSATPVICRDDVAMAMRLGFDRQVPCGYEHCRDGDRAFSVGRLRLLQALDGPLLCFMDDDIVMESSTMSRLVRRAERAGEFGFVSPTCHHAAVPAGLPAGRPHFSPGAVFRQDATVRRVLMDYYATTVDLLDRATQPPKLWEVAFLTEVFPALGRTCYHHPDASVYHLDPARRTRPIHAGQDCVEASVRRAREFARVRLPD